MLLVSAVAIATTTSLHICIILPVIWFVVMKVYEIPAYLSIVRNRQFRGAPVVWLFLGPAEYDICLATNAQTTPHASTTLGTD